MRWVSGAFENSTRAKCSLTALTKKINPILREKFLCVEGSLPLAIFETVSYFLIM